MRLYVHFDGPPAHTHLAKLDDTAAGGLQTVAQLRQEAVVAYNELHASGCLALDPASVTLLNDRKVALEPSTPVAKCLNDREDVFAVLSSTPIKVTSLEATGKAMQSAGELATSYLPRVTDGTSSAASKGVSASPAKPRMIHQSPPTLAPFLREILIKALGLQRIGKYKSAAKIFEAMLEAAPQQQVCLRGLGSMALAVQKYSRAMSYFQLGTVAYSTDVLFHARLGEALENLKQHQKALTAYKRALSLLLKKMDNIIETKSTALDEIDRSEAGDIGSPVTANNLEVASARCLYALGIKGPAYDIVAAILKEEDDNVSAILEYAAIAKDNNLVDDAMRALLRLVVLRKDKSKAIHSQLAGLVQQERGRNVLFGYLKDVEDEQSAPVILYIANMIKEQGAHDKGYQLEPKSASYSLNLIHTLETCNRHEDALQEALRFLQLQETIALGTLALRSIVQLLEGLPVSTDHQSSIKGGSSDIGFLLEQDRRVSTKGADARQLISEDKSQVLLEVAGQDDEALDLKKHFRSEDADEVRPRVTVPADFNLLSVLDEAKQERGQSGQSENQHQSRISSSDNAACSDGKHTDNGKGSIEYQSEQLDVLALLFTVVKILFLGGAVERARLMAGLVQRARLASRVPLHKTIFRNEAAYFGCIHQDVEEGIEVTVDIYINVLLRLIEKRGFTIIVHPVPPVLDITRPVVTIYNRVLRAKVLAATKRLQGKLHWLDFFKDLLCIRGKLRKGLELDGTHMSPMYIQHLSDGLSQVSVCRGAQPGCGGRGHHGGYGQDAAMGSADCLQLAPAAALHQGAADLFAARPVLDQAQEHAAHGDAAAFDPRAFAGMQHGGWRYSPGPDESEPAYPMALLPRFPFPPAMVPLGSPVVEMQRVYPCNYCHRNFALGGHQNAHKRERALVRSSHRGGGGPRGAPHDQGVATYVVAPSSDRLLSLGGLPGAGPLEVDMQPYYAPAVHSSTMRGAGGGASFAGSRRAPPQELLRWEPGLSPFQALAPQPSDLGLHLHLGSSLYSSHTASGGHLQQGPMATATDVLPGSATQGPASEVSNQSGCVQDRQDGRVATPSSGPGLNLGLRLGS
eukprot:SM000157S02061  [mRNA]  locus=s157:29967:46254:- [translate_table: standard]